MAAPRLGTLILNNASGTTTQTATNFNPAAGGTYLTGVQATTGTGATPGGTYKCEFIIYDTTNDVVHKVITLTDTADYEQWSYFPSSLWLPTNARLKARMVNTLATSSSLEFTFWGYDA